MKGRRNKVTRDRRGVIVAASLAMLLIGTGSVYLLVVSLKPIAEDFGWPRAAPSLGYSLQYLGSGIGSIAMGYWLDRSGMARPALLGAVMIGFGGLSMTAIAAQWQLFILYGVVMGLLGHATLFSPLLANVVRLYARGRGMAAGIVASGQTLAGALWPPVFRYFNDQFGWRETYFWYGLFVLCTMVPLSFVFGRPSARPAGDGPGQHAGNRTMRESPPGADRDTGLGLSPSALQTVLCIAIVGCCIAMSLPLAHLVAYATDLSHPYVRAAEMLALMLLTSTACRLVLVGVLVERLGSLGALFAFSAVQAVAVALLVVVDGLAALYIVAAIFGLGYGGILPIYPVIVRERLPAADAGRRTATVILFGGIGMALGGWLGGAVYDLTGGYAPAFLLGVAANLVNLVIVGMLIVRGTRGGAASLSTG